MKIRLSKEPAKIQLIMNVLLILVSVFVVSQYVLSAYYEELDAHNQTYVNQVNAVFEQELRSIEVMVETIKSSVDTELIMRLSSEEGGLDLYESYLDKYFRRVLQQETQVSHSLYLYLNPDLDGDVHDVWMTYEAGKLTRHAEVPLKRYESNDNMSWYYTPKELGHGAWLKPYYNRFDQLVSSYVVPIFHEDQYLGMLGMYLSFDDIHALIDESDYYKEGVLLIMNEDGDLINQNINPSLFVELRNSSAYKHYDAVVYNGWQFKYVLEKKFINRPRNVLIRQIAIAVGIIIMLNILITSFIRKE